ncbi:MAG: hypothetical protein PHX20_05995, partial [Candidatus Omnitrophica bacterium]|nr:hypothetical protein [Candidatus Omnitrophota bacterium]
YWLLSGEGSYQVEFYIEPMGNLKKQKLICLSYPRPTEDTFLRGRKLFYAEPIFRSRADKVYTAQEFADILGKLTRAAGIAEKG